MTSELLVDPVTPETETVLLGFRNRRVHDEVKLTKLSELPNIMKTPGEGLKRILGFVGLGFTLGEGCCIIYVE